MDQLRSVASFKRTHAPIERGEVLLGRGNINRARMMPAILGYSRLFVHPDSQPTESGEVVGLFTDEAVTVRGLAIRKHTVCAVGKTGVDFLRASSNPEIIVQRDYDDEPVSLSTKQVLRQNSRVSDLFLLGASVERWFAGDNDRYFIEPIYVSAESMDEAVQQAVQQMHQHLMNVKAGANA